MTQKDQNVNAAAQNETSPETTSPEQQPTILDLRDYVAALAEFTKNDPDATNDLQVLLLALSVNQQLLAQAAGIAVIIAQLEDGTIVPGIAQLA